MVSVKRIFSKVSNYHIRIAKNNVFSSKRLYIFDAMHYMWQIIREIKSSNLLSFYLTEISWNWILNLHLHLIWRKNCKNRMLQLFDLTETFVKLNTKTSCVFDLTKKLWKRILQLDLLLIWRKNSRKWILQPNLLVCILGKTTLKWILW